MSFSQFVVAFVLACAQLLLAPLSFVSQLAAPAVARAAVSSATVVQSNAYNITSPTVLGSSMWFSGALTAAEASTSAIYLSIYGQNEQALWGAPVRTYALPGYRVSDPSVVRPFTDVPEYLVMYYTKISDADAATTSTLALYNHIGKAVSIDGGATWQDAGLAVGQSNGLDNRGGWAPSALQSPSGETWLYYSTNRPGTIAVYRSRLGPGGDIRATEQVYLSENTRQPMQGFNVDVTSQGGTYVMVLNQDLGTIARYTSDDGINWSTAQQDKNPIIQARSGTIVSAPASGSVNADNETLSAPVYFASGLSAAKRLSTIQEVMPAAQSGSGSTVVEDTSSDSSSGSGSGGASSLLGMAGIVGLAVVAVAAVSAVSSVVTGTSFGGVITVLTPCISGGGPSLWMTIIPAGGSPNPFYIWTPETLGNLIPPTPGIPPTHIGQLILGKADIPFACYIPPSVVLYGERIQFAGVSDIPSASSGQSGIEQGGGGGLNPGGTGPI